MAAMVSNPMPTAAIRIAPPNASRPGVAVARVVPIAPATASRPIMPASMSASPRSAIGPAAASCVAENAISDIPAAAMRIAPPNARSPFCDASSCGPNFVISTIAPAIPAAITAIPIDASGPASPSRIAASARSQKPAAAMPNPTPAPRIFFAVADMTLLTPPIPFFATGVAFPTPFMALVKAVTSFAMVDITLNAPNPAATAGIRARIFSNGFTWSSPRKSTYSLNASFAAFMR